ncbi:hypothetical protein E4K64_28510 [Bradyrhizobium frederickii]|uniref:Uncharacterized protein n=1 Tax=Bradyrhizobium frederickii TaxID=2560054 RepID=A0A4Y9NW74_9BRAD|nr:hypothetical protein [Bradyrhizobium frederickii]TFV70923.1 hypothetical protein E4K64_28510 [Bradyrhizobium frederickii]
MLMKAGSKADTGIRSHGSKGPFANEYELVSGFSTRRIRAPDVLRCPGALTRFLFRRDRPGVSKAKPAPYIAME